MYKENLHLLLFVVTLLMKFYLYTLSRHSTKELQATLIRVHQ